MNKFLRNVGFYLLIILVAISIIDYFSTKNTNRQEVEYTQFLRQLRVSDLFVAYKSGRLGGQPASAHVLNMDLIRSRCEIHSFDAQAADIVTPWDDHG